MDSDWVMVIITAVYVIATIAICVANIRSANATKEQLEEMKKQYGETERPIIEAEFLYINRLWFGVRFVNNGKHTAQNVKIYLSDEFIDSIDSLGMVEYIKKQKEKSCVIGVNQHYDLIFGSYNAFKEIRHKKPAIGQICYSYNKKEYSNDFYLDFENYMTIFTVTTSKKESSFVKELRNYNYELGEMNQTLRSISNGINSLREEGNEKRNNNV